MARFTFFVIRLWIFILGTSLRWLHQPTSVSAQVNTNARYFHTPIHELMQSAVYLKTTPHNEVIVSFADKGSDLKPDDYLTHADGIRLLNGDLTNFLKSGEKEAIVPVVDEADYKHGGNRLLGFVIIQPVNPRKLTSRRGEVIFDFEEGGPAPTMKIGNIVMGPDGAKTTSDPNYHPPPHGGGACITGKDCYNYNGSCSSGVCTCLGPYTGTYCQLNRPDFAALSVLAKKNAQKQGKVSPTGETPASIFAKHNEAKQEAPVVLESLPREAIFPLGSDNQQEANQNNPPDEATSVKKGPKRKKKTASKGKPIDNETHIINSDQKSQMDLEQSSSPPPHQQKEVSFDDLYGDGRPYPEPYAAGKVPHGLLRERQLKRVNRESFVYSVRFRSGPLGIVFDNKINNATIVEKTIRGQQAEQSDIKEGDKLIAIETFNMTIAPPKATQRVLNDLSWPKVLVFESKISGEDPKETVEKVKSRTFNMTIFYPPTLVGEYTIRLADWAPGLDLADLKSKNVCPIYKLKASEDPFGCNVPGGIYDFNDAVKSIIQGNGVADSQIEKESLGLALTLQEALAKRIQIEPRTIGIMKRGICTFVEKAKTLSPSGANLGLVVNTEDEVIDLPAGKEKTNGCNVPLGSMKLSEGQFIHLAARSNEVLAVLSESDSDGQSIGACDRVLSLAEDLIDKWPHSVPPIPSSQILQSKLPDQSRVRGLTEEGGRLALSGENGWAFFDYHLAMFGPQEVPLGPLKLVMAIPPFGCDPSAYTVRVADAIVAILRGGGCSFGIKVINAQKLGAKAVMIVNTDDMKTMRLMALPDEVPLINISTIMVSRRIQYYLEEQIRPYFPLNQHLVSIQPTGIFGDYEVKNPLVLPPRLAT